MEQANIVKNLQKEFQHLFLEVRKEKQGLGTAYIHGFKWAFKKTTIILLKWMQIFLTIQKI